MTVNVRLEWDTETEIASLNFPMVDYNAYKWKITAKTNSQSINVKDSTENVEFFLYIEKTKETIILTTMDPFPCKLFFSDPDSKYSTYCTFSNVQYIDLADLKIGRPVLFARAKIPITHHADGNISMITQMEMVFDGNTITWRDERNIIFPTIDRKSDASVTSTNVQFNGTVPVALSIKQKATNYFTHNVYMWMGASDYDTAPYKMQQTLPVNTKQTITYQYMVPNAWNNAMGKTSSKGTFRWKVVTMDNNVVVGQKAGSFTALIYPYEPTITNYTAQHVNVDKDISSWNVYVKNHSKVRLSCKVATSYGADIISVKFNGAGYSGDGSYNSSTQLYTFTTGILNTYGSKHITVTIKDSRGKTAKSEVIINILNYTQPTLSANIYRGNSSGASDPINGTYLWLDAKTTYNTVSNLNTLTRTWKITTTGATGTFVNGSQSIKNNASVEKTYTVTVSVADKFFTITQTTVVPSSLVTMDFRAGGKGVAIGKVSESDIFDVNFPSRLRLGTTIDGTLMINGDRPWSINNEGTGADAYLKLYSDYTGKYVSISNKSGKEIIIKPDDETITAHATKDLPLTGGDITGNLSVAGLFTNSGIGTVSSGGERALWIAHGSTVGRPVLSDSLTYNATDKTLTIDHSTANKRAAFLAKRSDAKINDKVVSLYFGIGTGGTNRGIYDEATSEWIIYRNSQNQTIINGLTVGSIPLLTLSKISDSGTLAARNGELVSGTLTSTATTSGTSKIIGSTFTFAKGTYIIDVAVTFASNANGYRRVYVLPNSTSTGNAAMIQYQTVNAVSGAATVVHFTRVFYTDGEAFKIAALQNSGSSINASAQYSAYKIS